jgi:hypothetical protein
MPDGGFTAVHRDRAAARIHPRKRGAESGIIARA